MAPIAPGKYGRTSVANPVNSKDFMTNNKKTNVRPDERFFLTYFKSKGRRDERVETNTQKNKEEEDDDEIDEYAGKDPDEIYGNDPEEEAYAQELAENMMAEHAAANPDDDDEPVFDWSDDGEEDEDGDSNDPDGFLMGDDDDDEDDELFDEDDITAGMAEFDDDDDDEEEEDDDDEEEEEESGRGKKRGKDGEVRSGTFAEADEFADILDNSGKTGENQHQLAWEKRNDWRKSEGRGAKKRRKR